MQFGLHVDNTGECFWKQSTATLKVTVGRDPGALYCTYKVRQVGPRSFAAEFKESSGKLKDCIVSGGVDIIKGSLGD